MLADTVTVSVSPVELPAVGLRFNQLAPSLTVQLSVPSSEFQILRLWLLGFAPFLTALKLKDAGEHESAGCPDADTLTVEVAAAVRSSSSETIKTAVCIPAVV
ncbi:hypothetical protein ES703_78516 [subsurface metagenome]